MPTITDNQAPGIKKDADTMIVNLEIIKNRSRFYAVAIDEIINFMKEQNEALPITRLQFDCNYVKSFKAQSISYTSIITSVMHDAITQPPWVGKPMAAITELCSELGISMNKNKLVDLDEKPRAKDKLETLARNNIEKNLDEKLGDGTKLANPVKNSTNKNKSANVVTAPQNRPMPQGSEKKNTENFVKRVVLEAEAQVLPPNRDTTRQR